MKYSVLLVLVFIGFIIYAGTQIPTGITGRTDKNGFGCNCHSPEKDGNIVVQISGPDTLFRGQTGNYSISLSGGPAVRGGFNVASHRGLLAPVDGSVKLSLSELTHTSPKSFAGSSTVSWQFTLTALDSVYKDTIYSVANSTNGDGNANAEDRWNFGNRFVVHVVNQPSSVEDINLLSDNFQLYQNYPNPFNPNTVIGFNLPASGFVKLIVYDVSGREITTLIDGYRNTGYNEANFNGNELSSGIYFYNISSGNNSITKKMLLIR